MTSCRRLPAPRVYQLAFLLWENVSPSRSLAFEAGVGLIRRMVALVHDCGVNLPYIDSLAGALASEYDETVAADPTGMAFEVLDMINTRILEAMEQYLAACLARLDEGERDFMAMLVSRETSRNR